MPANRNRVEIQRKREEAQQRQERCNALTPKQRLKVLDDRLGRGLGAVKERTRLKSKIIESV